MPASVASRVVERPHDPVAPGSDSIAGTDEVDSRTEGVVIASGSAAVSASPGDSERMESGTVASSASDSVVALGSLTGPPDGSTDVVDDGSTTSMDLPAPPPVEA